MSGSGTRRTGQSKIKVVSDVNDCDLQRLPRSVFRDNSRFVSIVILLSLSSSYPPCEVTRACSELQADLQGAADLQAGQEWPFLFVAPSLEIIGKYRKSGPRRRNARKKRSRLFRYIAEDDTKDVPYLRAMLAYKKHGTKRSSYNRSISSLRLLQLSREVRLDKTRRSRNRRVVTNPIHLECEARGKIFSSTRYV